MEILAENKSVGGNTTTQSVQPQGEIQEEERKKV